ncbi:MAG: hypothetical protein HUK20_04030 [Fibrobacter sp.]|nr:hypothetical protein [Fibrobacter sp.]
MKKLIAFIALMGVCFCMLTGCAGGAQGTSAFQQVSPLKGQKVALMVQSPDKEADYIVDVATENLVDSLKSAGVEVLLYKSSGALSLSDENPVVAFAAENQAKFILIKQFTKIGLYNAAVDKFEASAALYETESKKQIWRAAITYSTSMPFGYGPPMIASVSKTMELLVKDGFLVR